jgi:hypothetical protein
MPSRRIRRLNLVGHTFPGYEVLGRSRIEGLKWLWWAKCLACGKVRERSATVLDKQKSCGCLSFPEHTASRMWKGCGELSGQFYVTIRCRARKRKVEWGVSIQYLWELFSSQKGLCSLSGLSISLPNSYEGPRTASLDRIDSSKGYLPGNVQWVHKDINPMKLDMSQNRFLGLCQKISEVSRGICPTINKLVVENDNQPVSDDGLIPISEFKKDGVKFVLCKCRKCGKDDCIVRAGNVKRNRSCGCIIRTCQAVLASHLKRGQLIPIFVSVLRNRAAGRGVKWALGIDYLWELYKRQNGQCALSGESISLPRHRKDERTASLDRIDSSMGYLEGNVQWVHKDVNIMKRDMDQSAFIELCGTITRWANAVQSPDGPSSCPNQ